MPAEPVLLDTWALLALVNRTDPAHARAMSISEQFRKEKRPRVVTEWTLTEFLSSAAKPPLRMLAVQLIEQLHRARRLQIVEASTADWHLGFDLFKARADKSWSLVDCISIVICQRLGITEVFTADYHFEQAGLRILVS